MYTPINDLKTITPSRLSLFQGNRRGIQQVMGTTGIFMKLDPSQKCLSLIWQMPMC